MHIHDSEDLVFGITSALVALFAIVVGLLFGAPRRPQAMPRLFFMSLAIMQIGLSLYRFNEALGEVVRHEVARNTCYLLIMLSVVGFGRSIVTYVTTRAGRVGGDMRPNGPPV